MIKPSVVIIDRDKDNWKKLIRSLKITEASVTVGVHSEAGRYTKDVQLKNGTMKASSKDQPSVAEVAFWNEFGTSKTPERSFLRSTVDEAIPRVEALMNRAFDQVFSVASKGGDIKLVLTRVLTAIGFQVKSLVENKIKSSVPPQSKPSTIAAKEAKGSLHPHNTLMDTDLLSRSITYEETVK